MRAIYKNIIQHSWIGILILFIPCIIKASIPDSDTFFIAATGRYIVENGIVPTTNPFVIHEGFSVIIQQWLFDVLIYGIYNYFGNVGLLIYVTLIYAISMLLLYKYFGLFTEKTKTKNIVFIIASYLYTAYAVARPTGISFIAMLLLLYCMEKYRRTQKTSYLIALPFISLIVINMHAAMWPMMFVMMLPYVFPYTIPTKANIKENTKKWFTKNKYIMLTSLIMFATGFINPNGIKGMAYVLLSYGSATNGVQIQELVPPSTNDFVGIIIMLTFAFVAIYAYTNKDNILNAHRDNQEEFTRLYMALGTLILACMHTRNLWYLILGTTPIILTVLNNITFKKQKPKKEEPTYALFIKALYIVVLTITITIILFKSCDYADYTNKDSTLAPYKAVAYLDKNETSDITLYTEFNNGAFCEWHGYKVYMDARPELFQKNINKKKDIYTEYCDVATGKANYEEFLNKYNFTHLIVSDNTVFNMYLTLNSNYTAVVDGEGYTLYELNTP